jgi:hypothetical protein
MLKRLALVIHWVGFLSGAALVIGFLLAVITLGWSQGIFVAIGFLLALFLVPFLAGWVVRFILTGNKSFFPWKS